MYKFERTGQGVIGTTVEFKNEEMTLLKDEVEDMFELLDKVGITDKAIADKFCSKSAKMFVKNASEEHVEELFKNLRNVYHFLNDLTYNSPSSNKIYDQFFGIDKTEEEDD